MEIRWLNRGKRFDGFMGHRLCAVGAYGGGRGLSACGRYAARLDASWLTLNKHGEVYEKRRVLGGTVSVSEPIFLCPMGDASLQDCEEDDCREREECVSYTETQEPEVPEPLDNLKNQKMVISRAIQILNRRIPNMAQRGEGW